MEQRGSPRRRVEIDVDVSVGAVEPLVLRTRDVSLGGVYLHGDRLKIDPGTDVQLMFHISGERATMHGIRATLVRSNDEGYGMVFRHHNVSEFRTLQEILRVSKEATNH
jgi:hypothetical protein